MRDKSKIWKENWEEAARHHRDWWEQCGLVVSSWGMQCPLAKPRLALSDAPLPKTPLELHSSPELRARINHCHAANFAAPLDVMPFVWTDSGPGSLAAYLGCQPEFSENTVWFYPVIEDIATPENLPLPILDPENKWWKTVCDFLERSVQLAEEHYIVPIPDLVEGIDILASMRGSQTLLMDLIERPQWVSSWLDRINDLWMEVFDRLYDIVKDENGANGFHAFHLWGPGKTAKLQCDISAMFSPEMFAKFAIPSLRRQCRHLDYSLFHLDGHQCIPHLDLLLEIEELDAVEWTPDPMVPGGGDPCWYDMYRRILNSGKSVQAIGVKHEEIVPLLDAVGPNGLYVMTELRTEKEIEKVAAMIEPYRLSKT